MMRVPHLRRVILTSLLLAVCLFTDCRQATHASEPPIWRGGLLCEPTQQHFRGVEYCTSEDRQVHVIVVDLHSPGVRLEYIIAKGMNGDGTFGECRDVNRPYWGPVRGGCHDSKNELYPVMSLADAVRRYTTAAAVINSDYGAFEPGEPKNRGHGPEGFTVVRGDRRDGPALGDTDNNAENRPWLAVSQDAPLRAELRQFGPGKDDGGKPDWVYTGVGGAPWLIRHGSIQNEHVATCRDAREGACRQGAAQTAAGLSSDGRWLFLVVDERKVVEERKAMLIDLAEFMYERLGVSEAIKFDGGGSSQLWYGGEVITPRDERLLSQYLAVIADQGHGIDNNAGVPELHASPVSLVFYDIVLPGETAELTFRMRNEGRTAWEHSGYSLVVVEKNLTSAPMSLPVEGAVLPGDTSQWTVRIPTEAGSVWPDLRSVTCQMHYEDEAFGKVATGYVIVLPEKLKWLEGRIREQIEEWQQQGEQAVEDLMQQIWDSIQKEFAEQRDQLLERLWRKVKGFVEELLASCTGSFAMLGLALAFTCRRRRRH